MFLLGSAYPTAKLGINASMPPILFGAMRMGIVFICLIPFCKIYIPNKKYLLPLIAFSLSTTLGYAEKCASCSLILGYFAFAWPNLFAN